jgi:hypothetical protein
VIIEYGTNTQGWEKILSLVTDEKSKNPNYRVIDIGGTVNGYSSGFVDLVVDFNCETNDKNLKIDICNEEEWLKLQEIVDRDGKFDYAICTHTLEDIYNPVTALKWLPRISKAGVITMPSKWMELYRHSPDAWLGYIHHKWIFVEDKGEMLVVPKMPCLEKLFPGFPHDPDRYEIRFFWNETIPFKMFMNNYLGPDEYTVIQNFKEVILG